MPFTSAPARFYNGVQAQSALSIDPGRKAFVSPATIQDQFSLYIIIKRFIVAN